MNADARPLDVFIVAGEVSGDHLGGALMQALNELKQGGVRFRGVGGPQMVEAGLASLFPMQDIAVMGFLPVLANLPRLLARIRATADAIIASPPDVLVIIDSPDFTHRVARRVRARLPHLPVVNYVSPTVWAWRPGRARRMRAYVDHVLALLPFEPRVHHELNGPACTYVGHPLIERFHELQPQPEDIARRNTAPPIIAILPGSRRSEISRLLDIFGETLRKVAEEAGPVKAIIPAVPHLLEEITQRTAQWPVPVKIVTGETEKFALFRRARVALAASGTVTLELGLAQTPSAVAYRVSKLEERIARMLVRTRWMSLTNIILGREVFAEFLQDQVTSDALSAELLNLLRDGPRRNTQLAGLSELKSAMELPEGDTPAQSAARVVIEIAARRERSNSSV